MRALQISALCALCVWAPAHAYTFFHSGTTLNQASWQRPDVGPDNLPAVPPSVSSAMVHYDSFEFVVAAAGVYTLLNTATNPTGWDNYTLLYSGVFDAATPLAALIAGNDNFQPDPRGGSGFTASLVAGARYTYVVTGFGSADQGFYLASINGPGVATLVPEPAAIGLWIAGLAGLYLVRLRGRV